MTPQTATATTPRNAAADDPILAARIRAGEGVGSAMPAIRSFLESRERNKKLLARHANELFKRADACLLGLNLRAAFA